MTEYQTIIISVKVNTHKIVSAFDFNEHIKRRSKQGWAIDYMTPPFKDLADSNYSIAITFKRGVGITQK